MDRISDSKAFISATNLKRIQETNPLDAHYVDELLVSSTTLNNATYYYPSSAGTAMAGYRDLCYDFYLVGNAAGPTTITLTIEATMDTTTPYWHDISLSGYELVTNATGVASYAAAGAVTTHGIWDFDNLNVKVVRAKVVVSAANNCTCRLYMRRKAL